MSEVYDPHGLCARPRPFLVAPYYLREDGTLLPDLPTEAPCSALGGGCRIVRDHLRERKTGPVHGILVIRCLRHFRLAFSVLPPGSVPHARERIAPFGPDGTPLGFQEEDPTPGEAQDLGKVPSESSFDDADGAQRFQPTILRAALDAASGTFWESEAVGYQEHRRSTQIRHLELSRSWLGIAEDLSLEDRHRRAEALGIQTLLLVEASGHGPRWVDRGKAVCRVLAALPEGACLLDRLLEAGFLAGMWGRPFFWEARTRRLREVVFRPPGTGRRAPLV